MTAMAHDTEVGLVIHAGLAAVPAVQGDDVIHLKSVVKALPPVHIAPVEIVVILRVLAA